MTVFVRRRRTLSHRLVERENDLYSEYQHLIAFQEKDVDHEEIVKYECADHADPPTVQESEEADDICAKHPQFRMV